MLAKKYKLPVQGFAKKKPAFSGRFDFFSAKTTPNKLAFSRFGAIISRKVFASAVKRNKLKRLLFRVIQKENYHLNPGQDVLFIFHPFSSGVADKKMDAEMEGQIKKTARLIFKQ